MSEDEILAELRTIRALLALGKEDELQGIIDDLTDLRHHVLEELDEDWQSIETSEIADEFDVSTRHVQRELSSLVDANLIEKRGSGRGTEYRASGLWSAAELVLSE